MNNNNEDDDEEEVELKESFNELVHVYNSIDENEIKNLKSNNYIQEEDESNRDESDDQLLQDLFEAI